jgi:hypothetical protein
MVLAGHRLAGVSRRGVAQVTGAFRCEVLVCWTDGHWTIEALRLPESDTVTNATDAMHDAAFVYLLKPDVTYAMGWSSQWVEPEDET